MTRTPPVKIESRKVDAHKGVFGRLLLVGGCRGMSGAISMSALGALRSGAGLVTIAVPSSCLDIVAGFHPGYMTCPFTDDGSGRWGTDAHAKLSDIGHTFDVIACGPGMSTSNNASLMLGELLEQSVPLVLDADALNLLAIRRQNSRTATWADLLGCRSDTVLTPHPKEMERLSGVHSRDRSSQIQAAAEITKQTKTILVLKGGPTVVIADGMTWVNETGNPGMATAGSGDVLTGIIASFLGQGLSGWNAARLGVWVHGKAGDIGAQRFGHAGLIATDIIDSLPDAMKILESN
ncbi:MAG: NAD(P)H-hydrate dehydratase [Rubripirellula sp.]